MKATPNLGKRQTNNQTSKTKKYILPQNSTEAKPYINVFKNGVNEKPPLAVPRQNLRVKVMQKKLDMMLKASLDESRRIKDVDKEQEDVSPKNEGIGHVNKCPERSFNSPNNVDMINTSSQPNNKPKNQYYLGEIIARHNRNASGPVQSTSEHFLSTQPPQQHKQFDLAKLTETIKQANERKRKPNKYQRFNFKINQTRPEGLGGPSQAPGVHQRYKSYFEPTSTMLKNYSSFKG